MRVKVTVEIVGSDHVARAGVRGGAAMNDSAAFHVRMINTGGGIEDTCTLASYVKANEHDADALYTLGRALTAHDEDNARPLIRSGRFVDTTAHAWHDGGAGGLVGLVIVDGPMPREPLYCATCGGLGVEARQWVDLNTGAAHSTDDDGSIWCRDCGDTTDATRTKPVQP